MVTEHSRDLEIAYEILQAIRSSGVGDPSGAWAFIRSEHQAPLVDALLSADPHPLAALLRNFFQERFSYGLISPPQSIEADLSIWREFTDGADITELATPDIGNPVGKLVGDIRILPDACRHHYLAVQIARLVQDVSRPTILEIGGGYGGLAWFLSKTLPRTTGQAGFCYIDCDLPTTLALSYYYLRSSTNLRITWLTEGSLDPSKSDVVLVPAKLRDEINCGVHLACNFISLSEMARPDVDTYFRVIHRNEPRYILHQNANVWPFQESQVGHREIMAHDFPIDRNQYREVFRAITPWAGSTGRIRDFLYERRDPT